MQHDIAGYPAENSCFVAVLARKRALPGPKHLAQRPLLNQIRIDYFTMTDRNLIVIVGQEGVGKSTLVRALLPHTKPGAQIDAEDLAQVNPFNFDEHFKQLLWKNVAALTQNYWEAGLPHVIVGSFLNDYQDYLGFRTHLPLKANIYLVHLCASKPVRDQRRIERPKPSTKEWRDWLDEHYPEDASLQSANAKYRYIRVANDMLSVDETVSYVVAAVPEVYAH